MTSHTSNYGDSIHPGPDGRIGFPIAEQGFADAIKEREARSRPKSQRQRPGKPRRREGPSLRVLRTTRRLGDPRVVPGFRCSSSLTPGSPIIVSVQNTDVDIGLRHGPKGSALPIIPQSVSCGARFSRLRWFATATACQVAGPPCTDLTGLPANGGFYFQAFDGSVALPVAGYDYNSVWTPCMGSLSSSGFKSSDFLSCVPASLLPNVLTRCLRKTSPNLAVD